MWVIGRFFFYFRWGTDGTPPEAIAQAMGTWSGIAYMDWALFVGTTDEVTGQRQLLLLVWDPLWSPFVLGRLLFLIFVPCGIFQIGLRTTPTLFADDSKIWTRILKLDDQESLQQDLDRLGEWSKKWLGLLTFNSDKMLSFAHWSQSSYRQFTLGWR